MAVLKLSDFRKMPSSEQAEAVSTFVKGKADSNKGDLLRLASRIAAFEDKFGFESKYLNTKMATGEIQDSHDVCTWLMLLKTQAHVKAQSR